MARHAGASILLARPMTAFCSWITLGILRSVAAITGGMVGYPPNPTTAAGLIRPMQAQGLECTDAQHRRRARHRDRIAAAQRVAGNDVDASRRKFLAISLCTVIGGEIDHHAAPRQRLGKRLRGKQMPAGPTGREQHQRLVSG